MRIPPSLLAFLALASISDAECEIAHDYLRGMDEKNAL
jgi:hypothetical protein